ncbi:MAG TPA: hypothetical protein VM847_07475 [Tahibacter sp.]|nr:hypothetical protein [Tahibacter sp.]
MNHCRPCAAARMRGRPDSRENTANTDRTIATKATKIDLLHFTYCKRFAQ